MLDLHTHSTASDGSLSPEALVERAARLGVKVLALTDHDTLAGLAEARAAGARLGVEVLTGVEISSTRQGGGSLHILGYLFDETDPGLAARLALLTGGRDGRNARMVELLTALGMPVTMDEVRQRAKGVVGRPHFADVLVAKGYVQSYDEAFDRWLAEGRPAYLEKEILSPTEAIAALHDAGGIAVLAHPLTYGRDAKRVEQVLAVAAQAGADGVEVHYGGYTPGEISMLRCFSDRYGLLALGGSDFHREPSLPPPPLSADILEGMRARADSVRSKRRSALAREAR
jgi:predicted metal-dependent phosphoesterase TrpH